MQNAGVQYTATWFPSVPGYAAMIIDSDPATTTGKFDPTFWWLCIDGFSSAAGLQTLVNAGAQLGGVEFQKANARRTQLTAPEAKHTPLSESSTCRRIFYFTR
jgi:hypothetical protein